MYKIISITKNGETINTEVEFEINGEKVIVDISHFQPQSVDVVYEGISNRLASETVKKVATDKNDQIIAAIPVGENIDAVTNAVIK